MTGLQSTLDRIGMKPAQLAALLNFAPATVNKWTAGESETPALVEAYLRVLIDAGPEAITREIARLEDASRRFDDGVYGLSYTSNSLRQDQVGEALAILRDGQIFGSDRWGGIYSGTYHYDHFRQSNQINVRIQVPPDGELVTGQEGGENGRTVDILAVLDRATPVARTVVNVAGHPIEIQLTYIGPLPH